MENERILRTNFSSKLEKSGTRWRSWLRHYATSRKIVVLSPGWGGFSSSRTMAPGVDTVFNRNEYQEVSRG
jgi:hypothetical protein